MGMSGDNSDRKFTIVAETRRRWSEAEKRAIVEEASGACTNVSAVARRHGIKPALLYRWRKELAGSGASRQSVDLVPVTITQSPPTPTYQGQPPDIVDATGNGASGGIEIVLANGRRIRVGSDIGPAALKRIIAAVED